MAAYVAGEELAFTELVRRWQVKLVNYITRQNGSGMYAEDIAQEVWLRVHRHAARFVAGSKFSTWLFTIAHNLCINHWRDRRRQRSACDFREDPDLSYLKDPCDDPLEALERQELRDAVVRVVDRLPAKQRRIIRLRHFEDREYGVIGQMMGLPGGTVKSRLSRARQTAAKRLAKCL